MEIVMIGEKYLASGFRLVGVNIMEAPDDGAAAERVKNVIMEGKYRIIFITEKVALRLKGLRQDLRRTKRFYPIFVIIPDLEGPLDERPREIQQLVNEAIGAELKIRDQKNVN